MAAFGSGTNCSTGTTFTYSYGGFATTEADRRWRREEDERRRKLIIRGDAYGARLKPNAWEKNWKKALVRIENHANFQFFLWSRTPPDKDLPMWEQTDKRALLDQLQSIVMLC